MVAVSTTEDTPAVVGVPVIWRVRVSGAESKRAYWPGKSRAVPRPSAAKATAEGRFKSQILPIKVKVKRDMVDFDADEHIRSNISSESLGGLRTVFKKEGGSVTVKLRAQFEVDEKLAGRLGVMIGREVTMSIEPPAAEGERLAA